MTARTKREIFGEFVCLKPPLRLDGNILGAKLRDEPERVMLEVKGAARCERWREGGREEMSEKRREGRHAGKERERKMEREALKQK